MLLNSYQGKRVLVTGHSGFKGSWLACCLQLLGAKVSGVSLAPNTEPNHISLLNNDINSHHVDIRDGEKIKALINQLNPEIIFHLAAQPLVRDSYEMPLYTFETNVMGTANILNAARGQENLKAIIVVTSDKCYENKEWARGYRENDPMGGYDPYSASKGCAELVTASFRRSFFNLDDFGKKHQTLIASARAGNVIGGGDWAKDRLIPDIVRAIAKNEIVQIRNPKATRPWQHVLECLSGYLCLGEKLLLGDKQFAGAWNFGPLGDATMTVEDIVLAMQAIWPKLKYKISGSKENFHEANLLKLDCSKARNLLKWQTIWNADEAINRTAAWYRDFYEADKISTLLDIEAYIKQAKGKGLFE